MSLPATPGFIIEKLEPVSNISLLLTPMSKVNEGVPRSTALEPLLPRQHFRGWRGDKSCLPLCLVVVSRILGLPLNSCVFPWGLGTMRTRTFRTPHLSFSAGGSEAFVPLFCLVWGNSLFGGVCSNPTAATKFVMPIANWGSSSTKSYTDRHYRVYN